MKKLFVCFLGKLVVIDFFATWCGPCKMISPKIEAMAGEMSNVVFIKVDVDEAEDVAQEYNISAMPTFVFLKNGQKVKDLKRKNICFVNGIFSGVR